MNTVYGFNFVQNLFNFLEHIGKGFRVKKVSVLSRVCLMRLDAS